MRLLIVSIVTAWVAATTAGIADEFSPKTFSLSGKGAYVVNLEGQAKSTGEMQYEVCVDKASTGSGQVVVFTKKGNYDGVRPKFIFPGSCVSASLSAPQLLFVEPTPSDRSITGTFRRTQ